MKLPWLTNSQQTLVMYLHTALVTKLHVTVTKMVLINNVSPSYTDVQR